MTRTIAISVIVLISTIVIVSQGFTIDERKDVVDWKPIPRGNLILQAKNVTQVSQVSGRSADGAVQEARKKHRLKYLFPGLLAGFGGYHAILAYIAIKVKIFLVGLALVAAYFYWSKSFKGIGGCPEIYYPHDHSITPYHSSDVISYSDPTIHTHSFDFSGSSYPGSSYSGPSYPGPSFPSSSLSDASYAGGATFSQPPPDAEIVSDSTAAAHYKRRVGSNGRRRRRSVTSADSAARPKARQQQTGYMMDFTNLIFGFLNVNTKECRKRFVCEVDYLARSDMFIRFGYRMLGPQLFVNYRTSDGARVKNLRECSTLHPKCMTPHEEFSENASNIDIETTTQPIIRSRRKFYKKQRKSTAQ